MINSLSIFFTFLYRDFYTYIKQLKNYIINYSIIYPLIFSLSYGYIIPNTAFSFGVLSSKTLIFTGSIIFVFLTLTFTLNLFFLTDLENNRFINYQLVLLNPKLIILERLLFSTLFNFFISLPFFGISKLLLQNNFDTNNLSIVKLLIILFIGSATCSGYTFLSMCILKGTYQLGNWWRRFNSPLFTLGGSWSPWFGIVKYSALLGYISLLNPMLYITEGIRGAIIGETNFIPFIYCVIALIIFFIIFVLALFYFFKKRLDHI